MAITISSTPCSYTDGGDWIIRQKVKTLNSNYMLSLFKLIWVIAAYTVIFIALSITIGWLFWVILGIGVWYTYKIIKHF